MYAKIDGAINPQNLAKAFIRGLLKQVNRFERSFEKTSLSLSLLENLSRLGEY